MSVLIYTETEDGSFKKNAWEVASYGSSLAEKMGADSIAVAINAETPTELSKYGVSKVASVKEARMNRFNAEAVAAILQQAATQFGARVIILGSSADARYLAGVLAGKLKAGYAPNVVALPESTSPLVVRRTVFSNKGFANTALDGTLGIIGVSNNAFGAIEKQGAAEPVEFSPEISEAHFGVASVSIDKVTDKVAIADADIVVSGGRGLKGPENWGMIEELASVLGAATACSKPVSDLGWRPHSEHVGQTGKPVASNLYIAIGISGAIQHLAGVNSSKTKVVINNDPEAPFFKAADYGVVGDAFDVVPELIEKLKEFKAQNG